MDVLIRKATVDDAEKIAEIKIDGWETAYKGILDDAFLNGLDKDTEMEKKKRNISDGASVLVAEVDGKVVGFCMYKDFVQANDNYFDADCEISALYVRNNFKRNGIGKRLMQSAIADLRNIGKTTMILECLTKNYPSRIFYEKMGGKILTTETAFFGGKTYEETVYVYAISDMKFEPIEFGAIVWYSGDYFESVTPIKVTGKNQKEISMFWNSLYFDTIEQAEQRNNVAHALYGKYQASAMG